MIVTLLRHGKALQNRGYTPTVDSPAGACSRAPKSLLDRHEPSCIACVRVTARELCGQQRAKRRAQLPEPPRRAPTMRPTTTPRPTPTMAPCGPVSGSTSSAAVEFPFAPPSASAAGLSLPSPPPHRPPPPLPLPPPPPPSKPSASSTASHAPPEYGRIEAQHSASVNAAAIRTRHAGSPRTTQPNCAPERVVPSAMTP